MTSRDSRSGPSYSKQPHKPFVSWTYLKPSKKELSTVRILKNREIICSKRHNRPLRYFNLLTEPEEISSNERKSSTSFPVSPRQHFACWRQNQKEHIVLQHKTPNYSKRKRVHYPTLSNQMPRNLYAFWN